MQSVAQCLSLGDSGPMRIRSTTRKKDSQDTTRAIISRTKRVLCSRSAAGRRATVRIRRTAKRYLRPRPRLRPSPSPPPTHPTRSSAVAAAQRATGGRTPTPYPPPLRREERRVNSLSCAGAAAAQRLWGRPPGRPGARSAECSKTRPAFIIARWEERRASRLERKPAGARAVREPAGAGRVRGWAGHAAGPGGYGSWRLRGWAG